MSIDWAMLDPKGLPVPLPGENFRDHFEDADVTVQTQGSTSTRRAAGVIHISKQRLVFVATGSLPTQQLTNFLSQSIPSLAASLPSSETFKTLSAPFLHMLDTSFIQPYFSANYLSLTVQPIEGGGLSGPTKVEIRLNSTGIYEFVGMVDRLRKHAIVERRLTREANTLPTYQSPGPQSSQPPPVNVSRTPDDASRVQPPPPLIDLEDSSSELPPAYSA